MQGEDRSPPSACHLLYAARKPPMHWILDSRTVPERSGRESSLLPDPPFAAARLYRTRISMNPSDHGSSPVPPTLNPLRSTAADRIGDLEARIRASSLLDACR